MSSDKNRLIELFKKADSATWEQTYENYAEYLLANGVIVLPCQIGQKVYDIGEFVLGVVAPEIYELRADEMTIEKGIDGKLNFIYDGMYINNEDMGETVFLTKEEAEQALENALREREQNAR